MKKDKVWEFDERTNMYVKKKFTADSGNEPQNKCRKSKVDQDPESNTRSVCQNEAAADTAEKSKLNSEKPAKKKRFGKIRKFILKYCCCCGCFKKQ